MSVFPQLDGSDDILGEPTSVNVIYQQNSAPNISIFSRVDWTIRSSQLNEMFRTKYPTIVDGGNLVEIIDSDHARTFFSEWFCNQNIPNILRNLVRLSKERIIRHMEQEAQDLELNQTFANLLEGKAVIRNSYVTDAIKEVSKYLAQELGLAYSTIYRICFVLVLTPNQRNIHLRLIPVHQDTETHSMLIDLVRQRLVTRLLELHEN